jgi:SM-20-related protein
MSQVLARPSPTVPATFTILDEFLAPQELRAILSHIEKHERRFEASGIVPDGEGDDTDPEYRRSRVLYELGEHRGVVVRRVKAYLPHILRKLRTQPFKVASAEAQITASNDGDFFHAHSDNAQKPIRKRVLTFVYYCHREPKAFTGGELRIYDSQRVNGTWQRLARYRTITPEQNRLVAFPSFLMHEVMPVVCPSRKFADSRFTLNGWLRRA